MAILHTLARRQKAHAEFNIFPDLASLPHFDPNAEDAALAGMVEELRAAVAGADAVIFCTPEYVFSLPAILKNAIEWCVGSTVFNDKPTAMVVASGAGEKTFESLALILKTIQCKIMPATMLHLKGVRAKLLNSEINDEEILRRLDELCAQLYLLS